MANYFQTGFTALQELAKMKEIRVQEIPEPFEGQQAYSQDGTLCVYQKGKWISKDEYDRGVYIRLLDVGDCV